MATGDNFQQIKRQPIQNQRLPSEATAATVDQTNSSTILRHKMCLSSRQNQSTTNRCDYVPGEGAATGVADDEKVQITTNLLNESNTQEKLGDLLRLAHSLKINDDDDDRDDRINMSLCQIRHQQSHNKNLMEQSMNGSIGQHSFNSNAGQMPASSSSSPPSASSYTLLSPSTSDNQYGQAAPYTQTVHHHHHHQNHLHPQPNQYIDPYAMATSSFAHHRGPNHSTYDTSSFQEHSTATDSLILNFEPEQELFGGSTAMTTPNHSAASSSNIVHHSGEVACYTSLDSASAEFLPEPVVEANQLQHQNRHSAIRFAGPSYAVLGAPSTQQDFHSSFDEFQHQSSGETFGAQAGSSYSQPQTSSSQLLSHSLHLSASSQQQQLGDSMHQQLASSDQIDESSTTKSNFAAAQSAADSDLKVCEWDGCGNTFIDMADFVKHLDEHMQASEKSRFFCQWNNCKRKEEFNARYKLVIHMRVHTGEKPYPCTEATCSKTFSRLENLKIHVRSHTGEKPYKCGYDDCKKSFTNSSDRIKHHKTHKDPKPYSCTHSGCMKKYTDPSSLRKHLKSHKRTVSCPTAVDPPESLTVEQHNYPTVLHAPRAYDSHYGGSTASFSSMHNDSSCQRLLVGQSSTYSSGCPADFDPNSMFCDRPLIDEPSHMYESSIVHTKLSQSWAGPRQSRGEETQQQQHYGQPYHQLHPSQSFQAPSGNVSRQMEQQHQRLRMSMPPRVNPSHSTSQPVSFRNRPMPVVVPGTRADYHVTGPGPQYQHQQHQQNMIEQVQVNNSGDYTMRQQQQHP